MDRSSMSSPSPSACSPKSTPLLNCANVKEISSFWLPSCLSFTCPCVVTSCFRFPRMCSNAFTCSSKNTSTSLLTSVILAWTQLSIVCTAFKPSSRNLSLALVSRRRAWITSFSLSATSATKSYLCSRWSTMVQSRQIVFWQLWQNSFNVSPVCFLQKAGLTRALEPSLLTSSRVKTLWPLVALILLCAVTQNSHMKTQQSVQRERAVSPLSQCSQSKVFPAEEVLSRMLNKVMKLFTQKFDCSLPTSPLTI